MVDWDWLVSSRPVVIAPDSFEDSWPSDVVDWNEPVVPSTDASVDVDSIGRIDQVLSIETEMGSGFVPCLKVVSGSKDVENPVEVVSDVDWSKSEVTVADVDVSCILLNEDVSYSFVSRELLVLSN